MTTDVTEADLEELAKELDALASFNDELIASIRAGGSVEGTPSEKRALVEMLAKHATNFRAKASSLRATVKAVAAITSNNEGSIQ